MRLKTKIDGVQRDMTPEEEAEFEAERAERRNRLKVVKPDPLPPDTSALIEAAANILKLQVQIAELTERVAYLEKNVPPHTHDHNFEIDLDKIARERAQGTAA